MSGRALLIMCMLRSAKDWRSCVYMCENTHRDMCVDVVKGKVVIFVFFLLHINTACRKGLLTIEVSTRLRVRKVNYVMPGERVTANAE